MLRDGLIDQKLLLLEGLELSMVIYQWFMHYNLECTNKKCGWRSVKDRKLPIDHKGGMINTCWEYSPCPKCKDEYSLKFTHKRDIKEVLYNDKEEAELEAFAKRCRLDLDIQ